MSFPVRQPMFGSCQQHVILQHLAAARVHISRRDIPHFEPSPVQIVEDFGSQRLLPLTSISARSDGEATAELSCGSHDVGESLFHAAEVVEAGNEQ